MRRDRIVTCEVAAGAIPALADDTEVAAPLREHVETCLHCQAELARYRRVAREVRSLRDAWLVPPDGALSSALAALHAQPADRRLAHVGRGVATAAGAAGVAGVAGLAVWRSRRRLLAG